MADAMTSFGNGLFCNKSFKILMSKSVLMKKRVCIIIEENKFKEVSDTVWGFFERYNYREDSTKENELRKNKTLKKL